MRAFRHSKSQIHGALRLIFIGLSKCLKHALLFSAMFVLVACSDNTELKVSAYHPKAVNTAYKVLREPHFRPPIFESITLPNDIKGNAIWGATGRDNRGKVYFGLSTDTGVDQTSHLIQYDPASGAMVSQSDTVTQLKKAKVYFPGLAQNKLQSKFLMGNDGYLYFSSSDETGQSKSRNPVYGGNLWRKLPDSKNWEHLLTADEGLASINVSGQFVYALGYWNHVLFQYDTISQRTNHITIGSIDGHVSRNFVLNKRGHAFIPRVEITPEGSIKAVLIEVSSSMAITDIHPLDDYINMEGDGIVAYTLMKNGDAYFTVSTGGLYHITESTSGRHNVHYLGKFDSQFENSYISSLFSPDGTSLLVGLGKNASTEGYYWYIRELNTQVSVNYPIDSIPDNGFLLSGSYTTDNHGNMYIAGKDSRDPSKHLPVLIKASYPAK